MAPSKVTLYSVFFLFGIVLGGATITIVVRSKMNQPVSSEAIYVEDVKLGKLAAGEVKPFTILLRNKTAASVHLLSPVSGCGCIGVKSGPVTINAKESEPIQFQYRAGFRPAAFHKTIKFFSADGGDVSWTVSVDGEVDADVWTEPSEINVVYDPEDNGKSIESKVTIHRKKEVKYGEIRSDNDAISVESHEHNENELERAETVKINCDKIEEGKAKIVVFAQDGRSLATIPVRWMKQPPVQCIPNQFRISARGDDREPHERTIVIQPGPKTQGRNIKIEPVVSWVQILEVKHIATADIVRTKVHPKSMSPDFSDTILQISFDGNPMPYNYQATSIRED